MATCAIHFIWTTYGTWLPGDDRGHWSPLYDLYGHLKIEGHRLNLPDAATRRTAQERLLEPPKILSSDEIEFLAPILGHAATTYSPAFTPESQSPTLSAEMRTGTLFEQPRVIAAAIEPTHVHLLTGPLKQDVAAFVGRLKGSTSSALLRRPENAGGTRTWTSGYWKVFFFDHRAVPTVQNYIEEHNQRRGLPAAPWDWVRPT